MKRFFSITFLFSLFIFHCPFFTSACLSQIRNDCFWHTVEGEPIFSQGGGVFRFADPETGEDAFFWYGAKYNEAEAYYLNPTNIFTRDHFAGVTLYTSTDLQHWHSRGIVFPADSLSTLGWFGRMGVAYIKELKKYALIAQHNQSVFIALSDSPLGPFSPYRHIDMTSRIGTPNTGDQTVFCDEDTGRNYLVYSNGRGRNVSYISEIGVENDSIGLLDHKEVYRGESREGNCMFKFDGRYYLCASNIYGWDGSLAYYLVSNDIRGPYLPANDMLVMEGCEADYAHVSQTGFFYTVRGSKQETVVFCGDRWAEFAGNGTGFNQWMPLSFKADGSPVFHSLSSWQLDVETGRWEVLDDNNWILNGSFEADRRDVPIAVKPRQEFLRGWNTDVLWGEAVSLDNPRSPKLNHRNSEEERRFVSGEHSLCMGDSVAFGREVSQDVTLEDGTYRLSFKYRCNGKITRFQAVVESGGKMFKTSLLSGKKNEKSPWHEAHVKARVRGGKARIVFHAEGEALAECLVDDVSLVKR